MIGRIQRSADFERVLGSPSRARSAHFAVHHIQAEPTVPGQRFSTAAAKLSTATAPAIHSAVDETPAEDSSMPVSTAASEASPAGRWLGCVIPKRHARRSVTRSLLKRQIRATFGSPAAAALPPGLWVVRLRSPYDSKQFPSAASDALRAVVRRELAELLDKLLSRPAIARASA